MYYPMVGTVIESLYSTSFINPNPQFVGLDAYGTIFGSPRFRARSSGTRSSGRSFVVLLQNLLGFATALLLNQSLPGQRRDALAGPAALGPARRRRRDPLALHVRPAARPDQFAPDEHRPRRPGRRLARRLLDSHGGRPSSPRSGRAFPSPPSSISPRCRPSTRSRSKPRRSTAPARSAASFDVVIPACAT